jgi:hypothetical protein
MVLYPLLKESYETSRALESLIKIHCNILITLLLLLSKVSLNTKYVQKIIIKIINVP